MCVLLILSGLNPFVSSAQAQLLNMPLPTLPENQEVLVLEINLAPGQESQPRRVPKSGRGWPNRDAGSVLAISAR